MTSTRELCWQTNNTCEFYSHCIDSLFHCGQLGFASAYAERWCEAVRLFHTSTDDCASCLGNSHVDRWAKDHERCFQQRLYRMVTDEFQGRTPDPPTCLHLERRAFEVMQTCYASSAPQLCAALERYPSTTSLQNDIAKVAEAGHISDYYGVTSRTALSKTLNSCGHTDSQAITDSVLIEPQKRRVVFCGAYKQGAEEVTDIATLNSVFLTKIAFKLSLPPEQFTYVGSVTDNRCSSEAPLGVSETLNFHFVVWRPEGNDTLPEPLKPYYSTHSSSSNLKFFMYQNASVLLCGDGVRQAGEVCDQGVYNGAREGSHTLGCTLTCEPQPLYECSGGQLEYSQCWKTECGNGRRESGEGCDDGRQTHGNQMDGCSNSCHVDPDFRCSTSYNKTSECEKLPPLVTTTYPSVIPTTTMQSSPTQLTATPSIASTASRTDFDSTPTPRPTPPPTISASSSRAVASLPHRLMLMALVVLTVVLAPVR